MFSMMFDTGNAAFHDPYGEEEMNDYCTREEVARILENVAFRLRNGNLNGKCIDTNGNCVGEFNLD